VIILSLKIDLALSTFKTSGGGVDSVGAELDSWLAQMIHVDAEIEAARQRIGRLSRAFVRVLESAAAEESVTVGDLETLSVIRRLAGAAMPGQIATALHLTSGTVSTRLRRLEAAGLVQPGPPDPLDGRVRRTRLSPRGLQVWRSGTARRTKREAALFDDLDPAQLHALNATLSTLLERFERELGGVSRHDRT
jgi:DNA-binding MarR family transcriptional regulator